MSGSGNSRVTTSSSGNVGGGGGGSKDKYRCPLLTEELLLVHNRGMEKKMIDTYKDSKKSELRFVKNRTSWRHHKTGGGAGASAQHRLDH